MYYVEDRGIIIARQEEIFEKKEYKHIQKLVDDHLCLEVQHMDDNILIFKILKKYEGRNKIRMDDGMVYVELLCLCSVEIMCGYDIGCIVSSHQTHYEQLQKIRSEYGKLGFNIPKITSFPKHLEEYGDKTYTIVPLLLDQMLDYMSEYTDDEEAEEEAELEDENLEYLE